nr:hypothetical protein [Actinomycetes bacterium]
MSEKHQAIINDVGIEANGRNWLCYADSQLCIAETVLPLATLAAQWGTPLYITHLDSITARAKALRAAFPCPVSIHYAVKANPRLALL